MRTFTRISTVIAGSAVLVGGMALPASAADDLSETNTATVEIEAGFLVLDTADAGFALDHSGASVGTSTATGVLTGVKVTDTNSDGLGWTSTVSLTNLTVDGGAEIISATGAVFATEVTSQAGGASVGGQNGIVGTAAATNTGNSTATWNTTVTIQVPNTVKSGTYAGTLTHSLA